MNSNLRSRNFAGTAIVLLGVGLLAALPLRLYQLMSVINPATGFYTEPAHWSIFVLYVLLGLVAVTCCVLGLFSKNIPVEDIPKGKNSMLAIGGMLFAAGLFFDFILRLIDAFDLFTSDEDKWGMTQLSSGAGGVLLFLQSALALAACFYVLIYVVTRLGKGIDYRNFALLALTPALWVTLRLVTRFLQPMNYRNVSEILLEMLMLVFMMLFFWYFARVSSNIDAENHMCRCYALGLPAVLFALVCAVPRAVLLVFGWKQFLVKGFPVQWCDLAAAVFILCYLFAGLREAQRTGDHR